MYEVLDMGMGKAPLGVQQGDMELPTSKLHIQLKWLLQLLLQQYQRIRLMETLVSMRMKLQRTWMSEIRFL